MGELRIDIDDVQATAAFYHAQAGELAGNVSVGEGQLFQPSAAAVQAVHGGIATMRTTLSARNATTGVRITKADARYVSNEAESAAELRAVDPRVV
jgi:hypothetical protein